MEAVLIFKAKCKKPGHETEEKMKQWSVNIGKTFLRKVMMNGREKT